MLLELQWILPIYRLVEIAIDQHHIHTINVTVAFYLTNLPIYHLVEIEIDYQHTHHNGNGCLVEMHLITLIKYCFECL